ncbi:hypothetical protein [Hydrogenovibrio sp. JE_KL2]|uniref:hypothetical protein n=1 Tax=Hydrogenovibrio sp. JE_KL2 TaxID=2651188 RepID=UPI00128CA5F6|nr:hypothetical protein [Hydrogenovibrio sp. JE_KL2]MPQ75439.1 hypothetical protein [Hydrogenovibrio sp. JE_KL2]
MDASQVSQITDMMYALRNPAGLPSYPIIFIGLSVLTFALHILFVQLMLGTSVITLIGAFSQNTYWRRLGAAMLEVAKVSVSVAIVIGVAPLLFVQVVYDPHWYTSNVLSADWVIGFIIFLILGYWAMYYYYFVNNANQDKSATPKARWSMLLSLALMLLVGFIMHSLTSQILHPELWKSWYMQKNGMVDYTGDKLHEWNLWRYAFFISLSIPVAGGMLVTYRRFKSVRSDADHAYLNWAAEVGKKWIKVGSIISTVLYVGWMMTLPETAGNFATSFWGILGGVMVLFYALWAQIRLNGEAKFCSYMALPMALVIGLVVAISREMLRYDILNGFFHYNFWDYKIEFDWYSTGLFFLTFAIVGGIVLSYFLTIAWKAGQTVGVYTPSAFVNRLGTLSIWIVVLWVVQFFVVGFYVWAR